MSNTQNATYKPSKRIARQLIVAVVLFSTVLTLIISGIQLYRYYQRDLSHIDGQLRQIKEVNLKTLTDNLWVADTEALSTHMSGILRLPDMQYLEIRDKEKVWTTVGTLKERNSISRSYPMLYLYRGKERNIGSLKVVATLDGVYSRLVEQAISIVISNGIKTFLVAGFILYLFQYLVTRHLVHIASFIKTSDLNKPLEVLSLERKKKNDSKHDELDLVVDELNTMRSDLQQSFSSLKKTEFRFRQLSENIEEVFWLGSLDWSEIYYISPAFEKIWGLKVENLYDNPLIWLDSVHPNDKDQVVDDMPKRAEDIGECVEFRDYRILNSAGVVRWIKARAYPIFDEQGDVVRIAGTAEDITLQKKTEEQLRHSQKMDALGKLTGGIAHDYNNILGVILGYSELLESMLDKNSQLSGFVKEIQHSGERGAKLTKKLLAFSKNKQLTTEIVDINVLLQEQRDMLEKTLTARIQLNFELYDGLWSVKLDSSDFEDTILNLCINAMHATPENGSITIQTQNVQFNKAKARSLELEAGDYVQINLIDTGSGMDDEIKERVFEPFFSTKGDLGSGLGLSQVYGFVERSGGVIKVDSELGSGTCMSLYLPRVDDTKSEQKSDESTTTIDFLGTETILVVDDEHSITKLLSMVLEEKGYRVLCANSAKEALDILDSESVDLMVSDIIMPEMNGYELAKIVQENYPEIKIQLASGFYEHQDKDVFDHVLQENKLDKPYKMEMLIERVRELLK